MYKFFIVLLGVTITCASGFHKIPLYRKPGSMRQELVGRMESRRSFDLTLKNHKNNQYYANIAFGSPRQRAVAEFDTASADMWVLSGICNSFACGAHSRYKSSASKSYEANGTTVNITYIYGKGSVEGFLSTDFITIIDVKFKQTFMEVQSATFDLLFFMAFDASVGMGFRSKSASGVPTMFENMMAKTHTNPIFSFYFNRDPNATKGGLLTLGGLNQSHFLGDLLYVPLVGSSYWMFSIERIHVGQFKLGTNSSEAIAATGYSYILAPTAIARKLYKAIAATPYPRSVHWTVNCTTAANLPALIFTISGKQFTIESSDYIVRIKLQSGPICLLAVMPTTEPHWVFGDIFLGRYYSVYDVGQKRIGFAEAVHPFIG